MEALRKQLGETEGHLQDRDKKYRELNATFKASTREWADRVVELEAAVKALRGQNAALESRNGELEGKVVELQRQMRTQSPQQTPPPGGLIITPENKRAMEAKYQKVKDRLAEAERRAEELEEQLYSQQRPRNELASPVDVPRQKDATGQQDDAGRATNGDRKNGTGTQPVSPITPITPTAGGDVVIKGPVVTAVTRDEVIYCFGQIRQCIRQVSIEFFSDPLDPSAIAEIPAQHATILEKLSPNWKSFLTDNGGFTSYIFRALIWRYLDEFLFKKPESVWGADIPQALTLITARMVASSSAPSLDGHKNEELRRWHAQTLDLLRGPRRLSRCDNAVLTHLMQTITSSIEWYIPDSEPRARAASQITEAVRQAAQLAALIARSKYGVMMGPKPGSELIHGFAPDEKTMSVRHQLREVAAGESGVVDLMVTPCLIATVDNDYSVLEKAEIMM